MRRVLRLLPIGCVSVIRIVFPVFVSYSSDRPGSEWPRVHAIIISKVTRILIEVQYSYFAFGGANVSYEDAARRQRVWRHDQSRGNLAKACRAVVLQPRFQGPTLAHQASTPRLFARATELGSALRSAEAGSLDR